MLCSPCQADLLCQVTVSVTSHHEQFGVQCLACCVVLSLGESAWLEVLHRCYVVGVLAHSTYSYYCFENSLFVIEDNTTQQERITRTFVVLCLTT